MNKQNVLTRDAPTGNINKGHGMNKYNSQDHHRRSIRLKGYDYSMAGLYFITICVNNQKQLFGHIDNDQMSLNDAGTMIEEQYYELEERFPNIKCHEMVTMPNHFHCIIEICNVRVPLVRDQDRLCNVGAQKESNVGAPLVGAQMSNTKRVTIGEIIGTFKSLTTNAYINGVKNYNWSPFHDHLWQRNFWEHIIRSEKEDLEIADYIVNNPQNWFQDSLNEINDQEQV